MPIATETPTCPHLVEPRPLFRCEQFWVFGESESPAELLHSAIGHAFGDGQTVLPWTTVKGSESSLVFARLESAQMAHSTFWVSQLPCMPGWRAPNYHRARSGSESRKDDRFVICRSVRLSRCDDGLRDGLGSCFREFPRGFVAFRSFHTLVRRDLALERRSRYPKVAGSNPAPATM
jgi:hypothetical protein